MTQTIESHPGCRAEKLLGWTEAEVTWSVRSDLLTPEDRERGDVEQEIDQAVRDGRAEDDRWHMCNDGSRFWASGDDRR